MRLINFRCSPSQLTISGTTPASKQVVILHDAPSAPPTTIIDELVTTDKIGALFITDDTQANDGNPYDNFPTDWDAFLSTVVAAQ